MGWMSVKSFGAVTVMVVSRGRDLREVKKGIAVRDSANDRLELTKICDAGRLYIIGGVT